MVTKNTHDATRIARHENNVTKKNAIRTMATFMPRLMLWQTLQSNHTEVWPRWSSTSAVRAQDGTCLGLEPSNPQFTTLHTLVPENYNGKFAFELVELSAGSALFAQACSMLPAYGIS